MNQENQYLANARVLFDPKHLSGSEQLKISKKSKRYRQLWMCIVVLGLFCFQMVPYAITQNLISPIASNLLTKWLEHNIILVNIFLALIFLGIALCGPLAGNWFSRSKKIKNIYIISFLITGIAFVCFSIGYLTFTSQDLAGTAIILYIFSLIMGMGISIFSNVGIAQLVNRWFPPSQKGSALGIIFMGGSLGTIIFSPALKAMLAQQWIIDAPYLVFIIFGCLATLLGIFFTVIIVRQPLPIYELDNDQGIKASIKNQTSNNVISESVSVAQAKRYPYWYILLFGELFLAFAIGMLITQAQQTTNGLISLSAPGGTIQVVDNKPVNLPKSDQANEDMVLNITTVYGVSCLLGNSLGGRLNDKIGPFKSFSFGLISMLISVLSILFSPLGPSFLPYLWSIFAGFGIFIFTSMPSYLSGNLFGAKHSAKHLGIFTMFIYGGIFIGLIVAGLVAGKSGFENGVWDNINPFLNTFISGNWLDVWVICVCFLFIGGILILIAIFQMKKLGIIGINSYYRSSYTKLLDKKHGRFIFALKLAMMFTKHDLSNTTWFKKYLKKHCLTISPDQKQLAFNKLDNELNSKLDKYLAIKKRQEAKIQKRINKNDNKVISSSKAKFFSDRALKLINKYETNLPQKLQSTNSNFKKYYYVMNYISKIEDAQFLQNKFEIIKAQNKKRYNLVKELIDTEHLRLIDLANKANDNLKQYYDDPSSALKQEYKNLVEKKYESKERIYNEKINKLVLKQTKNKVRLSNLNQDGQSANKEL